MKEPIIDMRGLSRRFGASEALTDISLTVHAGGVFGLVGENGAGKTTLIKHVLGLLRPQSGTVSVLGFDPVKHPVEVLSQVGYLSEGRDLPGWMRTDQFLSYTSAFFPDWDAAYCRELRDRFQLGGDQKVRSMSRGQQARLALLAALSHRPKLLVLDEPSSGLDPLVRRDILAAIIRTIADEGRTVLFSSHLLDEVQRVADHVAILHRGRLLIEGPLETLLSQHHLVTVRFVEAQQSCPISVGTMRWIGADHEWTGLCNGELNRVVSAANQAGGEVVEQRRPSLEEILIGHVQNG